MTVSSCTRTVGLVGACVIWVAASGALRGAEPVVTLRAMPVDGARTDAALSIEVHRWSTDAERAPLLAALSAPAAPPPAPAAAAASPAGRGGGRGARGGRGGRGGAAPPSPAARLAAAIKAAPTVGYLWGPGITGYSIKYAWRASSGSGTPDRIILMVARRLTTPPFDAAPIPPDAVDADYTLIDVRIDAAGKGEGRTSLTTSIVLDAATGTLSLADAASAPVSLRVTR